MTTDRIETFYKDVNTLRLKFPVAEIARTTGQSKGNVSKYLSKTLEPSNTFLDKFYKAYAESFKKVSREITKATETPQNGHGKEPNQTLTRIGELVKDIQYYISPKPTIEEIADKIKYSRPHLTTLLTQGDSEKAYTRLQKEFGDIIKKKKELQSDKLTTATKAPQFEMKSNGHPNEKDHVIKEQAEAANRYASAYDKQSDAIKTSSATIDKLVDLLALKVKDK